MGMLMKIALEVQHNISCPLFLEQTKFIPGNVISTLEEAKCEVVICKYGA
jgi:hypothetical protein